MMTVNTYYKDKHCFAEFVRQHDNLLFSKENTAILVQVFCGRNDTEYIKEIVADISVELPSAIIVGATTFGEIMNGEVSGLRTVISITVFQLTALRCSSFHKGEQDDASLGRNIAAALGSDKAKVLILFGAGEEIEDVQVLKGIALENAQLIVAGGKAGNNSLSNPALVFCKHDIISSGFVGVVLEGDYLNARLYSHIGWQPIGKEMKISEAKGNRVYSINKIPAYQVYRRYLGIDKTGFVNAVEFPLILNRNGLLMARTPRFCYADDSMDFFGDISEGETVRLSFGDSGLIVEMIIELCAKIQQKDVQSIFVYSCESRRGFLQDLSSLETRPLQKISPTSGFFTTGEYYHSKGNNYLLNATMTALVLAESGSPLIDLNAPTQDEALCLSEDYTDSIVERRTGVLKALTHLINAVTGELEAANDDLCYIGLHDSLTGTYNRTFFDREIKRLDELDDSIGIIVCDIDCLKLVNDTMGHEFADRIFKLLATILTESCRHEDIVARIGGDEFAVIVRGTTEAELAKIITRMKIKAQKVRAAHENNLIYFSVGFAHRDSDSKKKMSEVFIAADNEMYKCKANNKKRVEKEIMQKIERLNLR